MEGSMVNGDILQERTTDKTLEELKKEIEDNFSNAEYKSEIVKSVLSKKMELRKVFLLLIMNHPERIGKLMEFTYIPKRTLYTHLYQLIGLGLVKKISILNVIKKEGKSVSEEEKICLNKFYDWTATMAEGQKQLFTGKTNYWTLNGLGKNTSIIEWALICEKKAKLGEDDIDDEK